MLFIIIFTGILNLFFTPGDRASGGVGLPPDLRRPAARNALFMVLRIMLLIMGTFLMTYTTSPISLTDGLERLLNWMKKLHVPVHELAMMMSIALRFIPTLIEETDKIMSAQKARGADFESGNLIQKAKALIPILVPLFVSAFRRADELATAMECRCYHGGEGRTKLHVLRYQGRDYAALCHGRGDHGGRHRPAAAYVMFGTPGRPGSQGEPQVGAHGKGGCGPAEIAVEQQVADLVFCGLLQGQIVQSLQPVLSRQRHHAPASRCRRRCRRGR